MTSAPGARERVPRVLVLSRNYPNSVTDILGLWVERLVRASQRYCEPKVIAPVPYAPPLPILGEDYLRFRRVAARCREGGLEVFHPRFLVGPGHAFYNLEAMTYWFGVRGHVADLRRTFPFDLIHAHFTFPDGIAACLLARKYRVPVVITEQVPWRPWMDDHPMVQRQAGWAARQCAAHVAISGAVRDEIVHYVGDAGRLRVIPGGVDGAAFTLPPGGRRAVPNQIVLVSTIRPNKGPDVLVRAMRVLADAGRDVRLLIVGEGYYRSYREGEMRLRDMIAELGLADRIEFTGKKPLPELVRCMQESALLVLPSRAESFGAVLVEALACGTPVVATRCGGPEEIINDEVGLLVPNEDHRALAAAIEAVLDHPERYDPERLSRYALERYSWDRIARQYAELYRELLAEPAGARQGRRP